MLFLAHPHLSSSRRPPEWEWGRLACSSPPAASQTVSTLSQTVKESRLPSLWPPHRSRIAPPRKTIFSPTCPTSFRARGSYESDVTILADTSRAWVSFLTFSHRSFYNLAAISAMEAFVLRFLWSAATAAVTYTSPLINGYIFILIKVWSW